MAGRLHTIIVRLIVKKITIAYFGSSHWGSMQELIRRESGFNPYAVNSTSGACGLFQMLPCSKLKCELSDIKCQAKAGATYILARFLNPSRALDFQLQNGWY